MSTRDLVDDYWNSLSPEEREKWSAPLSPEEHARATELVNALTARTELSAFPTGPVSNLLEIVNWELVPVSGKDAADIPLDDGPLITVFLDGYVKRPVDDTIIALCGFCGDVSVRVTGDAEQLTPFTLPDGWIQLWREPENMFMCPNCAKTEMPE